MHTAAEEDGEETTAATSAVAHTQVEMSWFEIDFTQKVWSKI